MEIHLSLCTYSDKKLTPNWFIFGDIARLSFLKIFWDFLLILKQRNLKFLHNINTVIAVGRGYKDSKYLDLEIKRF